MIIYMVIFVPLLFVPAHKLQPALVFSTASVCATILGMFIWAMSSNHGAGNLVSPGIPIDKGLESRSLIHRVIH